MNSVKNWLNLITNCRKKKDCAPNVMSYCAQQSKARTNKPVKKFLSIKLSSRKYL